jgi:hypothetical protein
MPRRRAAADMTWLSHILRYASFYASDIFDQTCQLPFVPAFNLISFMIEFSKEKEPVQK